jgi:hypothetical protein
VPPAHPNCRCVLIPYIDTGDESERPAEAENFDQLARENYEKNPKSQKKYDELSYEYRRKLRYAAIKEYHDKTGKPPYLQVKGMTFADYLKEQPEKWQREWLGKTRFEMYKSGKLTLDHMVNPDNGFKRTVKELETMVGIEPVKPAEVLPVSDALGEPRDGWSKTFWKKLDKIKDYNSAKEIVVSSEMEAAIKGCGFKDVDDFLKQVNDYVKSNDVLQNVPFYEILPHLADEPILKNQFETGTSKGTPDKKMRREWEKIVSGGNSHGMHPRERPVYGYVDNVVNNSRGVRHYGQTTVIYKDSIRERTTFTLGNSSGKQGAFYNDVRAVLNDGRSFNTNHPFAARGFLKRDTEGNRYLEAQIWGCADLRIDVKEIALSETDLNSIAKDVQLQKAWGKFKTQMDAAGVSITHYNDWSEEFIQKHPSDWNAIRANVDKLGITFIRSVK